MSVGNQVFMHTTTVECDQNVASSAWPRRKPSWFGFVVLVAGGKWLVCSRCETSSRSRLFRQKCRLFRAFTATVPFTSLPLVCGLWQQTKRSAQRVVSLDECHASILSFTSLPLSEEVSVMTSELPGSSRLGKGKGKRTRSTERSSMFMLIPCRQRLRRSLCSVSK